jgi:sugar phosphate isomerase/epimerase
MTFGRIHLGGTARSPDDVVRLHDLGLEFAELSMPRPEAFGDHIPSYRHLRDELGMAYLCHGPREGNPNDTRSLEMRYLPKLKKVLSLMPQLDMTCLTIHLWMDPRFVTADAISYKMGFLSRVVKWAEEKGILLCIENLSETADHLCGVFEAIPRLHMTLDLGHAQLLCRQNTSHELIDRCFDRIRHVHMHDNRGGDSPKDDLHLPLGEGLVDFKAIFFRLNQAGYDKTMTLELTPSEIEANLPHVKSLLTEAGFDL